MRQCDCGVVRVPHAPILGMMCPSCGLVSYFENKAEIEDADRSTSRLEVIAGKAKKLIKTKKLRAIEHSKYPLDASRVGEWRATLDRLTGEIIGIEDELARLVGEEG